MSLPFIKSLAALVLGVAVIVLPTLAQDEPLKVGGTAGPHAQIFQVVKANTTLGTGLGLFDKSTGVRHNLALRSGR